jgi:dynein heavy chain
MFNSYLRENVLRQGVESWCAFVRKFTVPDKIDENIWRVNDYPMIVLNLEVNLNFKRKKDKPKHGKRKDAGDEDGADAKDENDEPIRYEPTIA